MYRTIDSNLLNVPDFAGRGGLGGVLIHQGREPGREKSI